MSKNARFASTAEGIGNVYLLGGVNSCAIWPLSGGAICHLAVARQIAAKRVGWRYATVCRQFARTSENSESHTVSTQRIAQSQGYPRSICLTNVLATGVGVKDDWPMSQSDRPMTVNAE